MKKIVQWCCLISLSAFLIGCGKATPTQVADNFWQAVQKKEVEKVKSFASIESQKHINLTSQMNSNIQVKLGAAKIEEDRADVAMHIVYINKDPKKSLDMEIDAETLLVQENGEWRVDLVGTSESIRRSSLETMFEVYNKAKVQSEKMGQTQNAPLKDGLGK